MRRTLRLVLTTTLTAGLAAATLTACTAAPAAACEATPPGAASSAVKIDGALGGVLTVDAAYPLEAATTQRSVLIEGSGDPLEDGRTGDLYYALYNGATGELIEDSHDLSADPLPFVYQTGTSVPGMEAALRCATAGSRVVAIIPPTEGFGTAGAPDVGLEPDQSIILVVDVMSVTATPDATGTTPEGPTDLPTPTAWTADVPVVDLAANPPTVTIPDTAAPTDLVLTVLQEGDGAVVPNPSTVTIDYVGTSWETKAIFDSSYARGTPATFSTSGVITGFAAALVGQKVGSTVLVSIPPALAYGTADTSTHELAGQTLVFLIHIDSVE